jgi:bacillithiol biosynthesis deacetylase BshB1
MVDVLAIAPHPDDIEIAAGGTVARLVSSGVSVGMIDLTRGESATRGTPELRAEEAAAASVVLGVAFRETLGLPDGGLSCRDRGHLEAVTAAIRTHRPSLILTLHENDDHPDHVEGAGLVRRAAYLAGLANWPGPGQVVHRPHRILFAMGRRLFPPSLIIDVTESYPVKRRALAAFQSQFQRDPQDPVRTPISEPGFLPRIEGRDRHYGGQIEVEFGEPFHCDVPLAVMHPRDLLPGARS